MLILQFRCQFDDALITSASQILILLVLVPYFNIWDLKKKIGSVILISGLQTSVPHSEIRHFKLSCCNLDLVPQLSMLLARVWHRKLWYYNFAVPKSRFWLQKLQCRSLDCSIIICGAEF